MSLRRARLLAGGRSLALNIWVCHGWLQRARGLLGRPLPPADTALWIAPCRAIHTFGMRYSIDVVFCDARSRVLEAPRLVRPRRIAWRRGTAAVLEARAGALARLRLAPGDRLEIR